MPNRMMRALAAAALAALALAPAAALAQPSASPYTSATRYDAMGRVTGTIAPDPDGAGPLYHAAVRTTYDGAGRPIRVETGELAAWQSEAVAPTLWADFTIYRTAETQYDSMGRKVREMLRDGVGGEAGTIRSVTQYSYDPLGRPECTAVRMNPAAFASFPASACTPGTAGSDGPDRITMTLYDAAGQRLQLREGVGSADEGTEASWAYNLDGQVTVVIDGNGNRAELHYDGHGRQDRWTFPSPTRPASFDDSTPASALASAGSVNANDHEDYEYDPNGNRTNLRKRDTRNIAFAYDNLNRVTSKTYPQGGATPVYYSYDLRNLQLSARFDSQSGEGVTSAYDGFGRLISSSTNMGGTTRTLAYSHDRNGNRTSITHPDLNVFNTLYDGVNRPLQLLANGASSLAYTSYTPYGLPALTLRIASRVATAQGYDGVLRPTVRVHYFTPGTSNAAWTYAFNPAGQLGSVTRDNDAFAWTNHYAVNRPYTTNGLNQYTAAGGATFAYDNNGNLVSDGTRTYVYDIENRLVSSSTGAALAYDPLGRLFQVSSPTTATTRFLYDGDALVAEFDPGSGSGTGGSESVLRRHVHWPGADLPMVTYEGSGLGTIRQLLADHQGSIVALADVSGVAAQINRYDEYGIPGAGNGGTFQYTGQIWLPELGMYYYKARIYSPTLGRFLQTDPIGYEGGINLYGYVSDDPINNVDPDGRDAIMLRGRDGSRTLIIPVQITVRGGTPQEQAATRAAIVARANSVQTGDSSRRIQVVATDTPVDGVLNRMTYAPGYNWTMCPPNGECTNRLGGDEIYINRDNNESIGGAAHDIFHLAGIEDGFRELPRDSNGNRVIAPRPGYTDHDIMLRRRGTQLTPSHFDQSGRNRTTRQLCEGDRGQHVRCPR